MPKLVLIIDNVRSAQNVGSLFRSADAFGVDEIILTGLSPYPKTADDRRLPHIATKATAMITKTALGAERTVPFRYVKQSKQAVTDVKAQGYHVYALEQSADSHSLSSFKPQWPCALIVGNELAGLPQPVLAKCEDTVEIPMSGRKESLNVAVAGGIALYALKHSAETAGNRKSQSS
ncbi:MAG: TrmH family RNA methyltransferase [Acidobacteriota bacterium]